MVEADLIGVVTVTYNSESVIPGFMDSLMQQSYENFRLYVVDNASADESLRTIERYGSDKVITIRNSINVGVAEGNNIGIQSAITDGCSYILLINNDTVFGTDLLAGLVRDLCRSGCDMIVPKILFFDDPSKIWCAGGYFSRITSTSRHIGYGEEDEGQFDHPCLIAYSPTCCMLIKSPIFQRVGLMDAKYFVYFDDTDFCYRAMRKGVSLLYSPSACLFHKVSSLTGGGESEFTTRYCTRNHVYFLLKNLTFWKSTFYLAVFQVRLLGKCIVLRHSLSLLWRAQKAFWEGIRLFRSNGSISLTRNELERQP
jgi:GT2 family glycosyltransferase